MTEEGLRVAMIGNQCQIARLIKLIADLKESGHMVVDGPVAQRLEPPAHNRKCICSNHIWPTKQE